MMRSKFFILFAAIFVWISPALSASTPLSPPQQEMRAKELFKAFRCPVCQSESIADSHADLAQDMRSLIREKVAAGESDEAIRSYLTKRYGDFILMQPPLKESTWLLWFGPLLALGIGGIMLMLFFRNNRKSI